MIENRQILVGLGGNIASPYGEPKVTLCKAVAALEAAGLANIEVSAVYQTAPVPATGQPDFINIALQAETEFSPGQLLALFQKTEKAFGRQPAERWAARTLDIDLLACGDMVLPGRSVWFELVSNSDPAAILQQPVVPHPRLHKRAFVLCPLQDIAPTWCHPCLDQTVQEMSSMSFIKDQYSSVRKISDKL